MSHRDVLRTLYDFLVIVPVGTYFGRIRKGVDIIIGSRTDVGAKVRVILVTDETWIQSYVSYKTEFVDKLKDYILSIWKKELGSDIICDSVSLPMNDEEYLTGWLLNELSIFFKTGRGEAFIDLTSAPKEWTFATINVLNFFPRVELYYVKPMHERGPKDYAKGEIEDEGHPKLETVRIGEVRQPLPRWVEPKTDMGELNIQYILFKTIFRLAQSKARQRGLNPSKDLNKVWVPIGEERSLREYRSSLPQKLRGSGRFSDYANLKKSISRHLTDVEPYNLFEVKGKAVRMTLRATMLGQALFGG